MNDMNPRESTREASAQHDSRDEYRAQKKYTHPFASSFSSSPIETNALSDEFHHSPECIHPRAYLPSSADTIETIDRIRERRTRDDEAGFATREDAPGDGGGRELRGRGHGWRESSTSADDDDEVLGLGLGRDDDRPLDRPTARPALARGWQPVVPLVGVRTSRIRVRAVGAVETIHVHPSLLGHTIHIRVHIYAMNTKKETHIRHHHRATERSKFRIVLASSSHVDARARDDERAMTRRGPSVDDELGELRVSEAMAMARKIQRETMRSHGIV